MLLVEHASHYRPLDPDQSAIGHRDSRCDAQRLSCEAAFTEKVTGAEYSNDGFLTLFGCNSQLDLALPDVEDGICRLALPEDFTLRTVLHSSVAASDFFEDCFPIDRQDFLSFQCVPPMKSIVACGAHSKPEALITTGFMSNAPTLLAYLKA